jgi:uncharacterized membrane protein
MIRIPLGLPVALFLPGFVLIRALVHSRYKLSTLSEVGLSFGLSIAVIPWITLILHLLGVGISPVPIAVSLAVWTLFWTTLALFLRPIRAKESKIEYEPYAQTEGVIGGMPARLLLGAITIGFLLPLIVFTGWYSGNDSSTEFSILGAGGKAEYYPREIESGEQVSSVIQIHSRESESVDFFVVVSELDVPTESATVTHATYGPFTIEPNEFLEAEVSWGSEQPGMNRAFRFELYRGYERTPYRTLKLTVDVQDSNTVSSPRPASISF